MSHADDAYTLDRPDWVDGSLIETMLLGEPTLQRDTYDEEIVLIVWNTINAVLFEERG